MDCQVQNTGSGGTSTGIILFSIGANPVCIDTNYQVWQDLVFYGVILPFFTVVFGWWAFKGFFKMIF